MRQVARAWQRVILAGLRVIVGPDLRGPRPRAAARRAGDHRQQAPVGVGDRWPSTRCSTRSRSALKEELTRIPVFGWYLLRAGSIRIDRGAAAGAIRSLVAGAKRAVALGLSVLIFPEGTRRAPGDPPDYKPGVAGALQRACACRWCRWRSTPACSGGGAGSSSIPGRIVVEFLAPIPAGLERKEFMRAARAGDRDRHRPAGGRGRAAEPEHGCTPAQAGQPPAMPL